jgi:serine/threonine protein phosphatase PrpC
MLDVLFGQASDPGKIRTNNEDAMGSFVPVSRQQLRSHGYLFAVADGLGGYELGEVASATAIAAVTEGFAKAQDGTQLVSLLPRLVQHANSAVHDAALTPDRRGKKIATTLVLCAIRYDQAVISHVGDSRCYLIRDGAVSFVTQDHTWVNEQRKLGLITAKEMAESESRHILIRSLGPELFISVDTTALPVMAGDILVLCSDGLHGRMDERAIAKIVCQEKDMDEIARELVAVAVESDGSDNTTAMVIRVCSVEKVGMYRGRPYILPSR